MDLQGRDLRAGHSGADVARLQGELTALGYLIDATEHGSASFGDSTTAAVRQFQQRANLPVTGVVDAATVNALLVALPSSRATGAGDLTVQIGRPTGTPAVDQPVPGRGAAIERQVAGTVFGDRGTVSAGLTVRLYHKGFGCERAPLGETRTDASGRYTFGYSTAGPANLQVYAVDPAGAEHPLSGTLYNAGESETVNLVAPRTVAPLAAEHQRLLADVSAHLGKEGVLGKAVQNDQCQDLTLLASNTGWDGRLVALAASADRLSGETGVPADALYALLRVGLPADAGQLAALPPSTVDRALTKATGSGVSTLDKEQLARAREALARYAHQWRLGNVAAPGTLSTVGQLLASSGLSESEQNTFAGVLDGDMGDGDGAGLWDRARAAGIPADKVEALRWQGRLAHLTLNNAPLVDALRHEVTTPDDLVLQDYHRPETWEHLLADTNAEVPPAYQGDTAQDRTAAYAQDLARKVRVALPTQVVARRVEAGELRADRGVVPALRKAAGAGFAFGATPVRAFLRDNAQTVFAGVPAEQVPALTDGIATLARVYQITPDDTSMRALLDAGLTSAHAVTAMDEESFVGRFAALVGGEAIGRLIHHKAQQVSAVVYNAFAAVSQAASAPPVYGISASPEQVQQSRNNLVKHYPTLEELFGSLDFCECDHCRSVLSPAAYLVDLLRFLDPDKAAWNSPDPTPYDRLVERRPDLPELPLTCENTNTVLPYIDIVNEILEFTVAGQTLSARDVGDARTADLIAEPQYLIPEAYDNVLSKQAYPLNLPFNLWLATVRQFLDSLGVPLADILDVLLPGDTLDHRRPVFLERLGLSPQEYQLYTHPTDTDWYLLYGYPDAPTAAVLSGARTLARRLGITYTELADVVHSRFVNPTLAHGPLLARLGLDAEDVRRYLAPNADPTRMSDVDRGAVKSRLTAAGIDDAHLQTLFDTDLKNALVLSDTQPGCGFDHTVVRHASGDPATGDDLKRINLLVRLRQRLGWTLSEVDGALAAFFPGDATGIGNGMETALLYLAHLGELATTVNVGRDGRTTLLSLWRELDSVHYGQLFLTPGVKAQDAAFDDPQGNYLSAAGVKLVDHLTTIQAATGLTAEDVGLILADNATSLDTAPLTRATVSLLYRYRLLARALRLSVRDLIVLKGLSGVDPFTPPSGTAVTTLAQDVVLSGVLAFTRIAAAVKDAGIPLDEVDYLVRDNADPAGPLRPKPEAVLALVRAIAAGIAQINATYPTPADPLTYTDAMLATAAPLAFPADVATTFLGMWSGTAPYYASLAVVPAGRLDPATFAGETALSVRYDTVRDIQWLTYRGVLSDPEYNRLKSAYPNPTFVALLDLIRPQAQAWFDAHLTGDVGPFAGADFHPLFDPAPDEATQRTRRKKLVDVFLPYLRGRLVRGLVIDTLAADRAADRSLVAALVTDSTLLANQLPAYVALGTPGLTLTYYSTVDGTGAPLQSGTVTDIDTSAKPVGARSAVVEGYLEVPASGAYAFTAALGASVTVELRFDQLTDPLLTTGSPANFTDLKAGTAYHVRLLLGNLAPGHDATVTVRADGLVDGAVGRLTCYAMSTVDSVRAAYVRLCKVLRLATALELSEAALRQFTWLDLNTLPFPQYLRLAEHVRLRRDLGVVGDDLTDVMRHARGTGAVLAEVCTRFGTLTRRSGAVVASAATLLGLAAADFADEYRVRPLWTVLSQAQTLGVTPTALGTWADPDPGQQTARDLRATLKARYSPTDWLRVAQPVSDALRRMRRDALVAYLLYTKGFDRVEELYEYFLVDPGTEPVVQTSRLRLAISSVQLFIQRCLLNLESPGVKPGALNAAQWEWMKRYRVWEANRKIFLWPENYLEPEWRDDKTFLFTALEGTLLQGEVSTDLAEDALFAYLTTLEGLARLEIMSTWLEEDPNDPARNTLHVLGRTHHEPRKYYYRTYRGRMWTPWEPVTSQVDGDHVVLAVWRHRPCLFWLSFVERAETPGKASITAPAQGSSVDIDTRTQHAVDIRLNWSELVQGQWSDGHSSGSGAPVTMYPAKGQPFDRGSVFVHASVTATEESETVQVVLSKGGAHQQPTVKGNVVLMYQAVYQPGRDQSYTHVSFYDDAFEMLGRNSPITVSSGWDPVSPPFTWSTTRATQYQGSGPLHVWYTRRIDDGKPPVETKADTDVLGQGSGFSLVVPPDAVHNATGDSPEIGSLARPFFYQNERHTFYVEPSVTETTFAEWDGWILATPAAPATWGLADHWHEVQIEPGVPVRPGDPEPDLHSLSLYRIAPATVDSVVGTNMMVPYEQMFIGQ